MGVDPDMNAGQQKKSHGQVGDIGEWVLFGNILQRKFSLIVESILNLVPLCYKDSKLIWLWNTFTLQFTKIYPILV